MTDQTDTPAHVPAELVYDFDYFDFPGMIEDVHIGWKRLHTDAPEIFWTPRNGGHWVATRAEDIDVMQSDSDRFSNAQFTLPFVKPPFPLLPLNLDPPEHAPVRALISPAFAPKVTQRLTERAREVAVELIDGFVSQGHCEFVGDFAKVLPVVVFLGIVDLPPEDRKILLPWADAVVHSADRNAKVEANRSIATYLMKWVEQRTEEPGDDLISKIAHSTVKGTPLTKNEVLGLCNLLLLGGLDTVAGMLSFAARYLADHPELVAELLDHPEFIPSAVDELMRRHGLPNTARIVTRDLDYKQIQFKKGDMVQLPRVLFNLDERQISDPMTVNIHRQKPLRDATFGGGHHKCPGALLARAEVKVFLEEWLKRIPRFHIRPGFSPRTRSGGVNWMESLELVWEA